MSINKELNLDKKVITYKKLMEIILEMNSGKTIKEICKVLDIAQKTYYNIIDEEPVGRAVRRKLKSYLLTNLDLTFNELQGDKIEIKKSIAMDIGGNQKIKGSIVGRDQNINDSVPLLKEIIQSKDELLESYREKIKELKNIIEGGTQKKSG